MTIAPTKTYLEPTKGQTFFMVRCGNVQAMQWLCEDLSDLGATFGAEHWPDGSAKPLVIVVDADLVTRQRMERYGAIVTWRCQLDLTGEYVSYGLEAQSNGQP